MPGRRARGRCVRAPRRLRRDLRCIRRVRVGLLVRRARPGVNITAFSGRIGRRALRPGRYRATLTGVDVARNVSAPARTSFQVVRR